MCERSVLIISNLCGALRRVCVVSVSVMVSVPSQGGEFVVIHVGESSRRSARDQTNCGSCQLMLRLGWAGLVDMLLAFDAVEVRRTASLARICQSLSRLQDMVDCSGLDLPSPSYGAGGSGEKRKKKENYGREIELKCACN